MIILWRRKALPILREWMHKHRLGEWIAEPHQEELWKMRTHKKWVTNGINSYAKGMEDAKWYKNSGKTSRI